MLTYLNTGDVNFDHLVKVLSAMLHYKVTIFLFMINEYLVGRYIETIQIFCFSSYFCPPNLAFISGSYGNNYCCGVYLMVIFYFFHFICMY